MKKNKVIYSIGHSSLSESELVSILLRFEVENVVDIRRFPSSKTFPQFNRGNLEKLLVQNDIEYLWLGELLGGFRKGRYEQYIESSKFKNGLRELESQAIKQNTVFMCAEKDYHRCHRCFIADELTKCGWEVLHIISNHYVIPHESGDTMLLNFE